MAKILKFVPKPPPLVPEVVPQPSEAELAAKIAQSLKNTFSPAQLKQIEDELHKETKE